jgi:hypothetical protein
MYRIPIFVVLCLCVSGCTSMQLSAAKYSAQGLLDLTKDRYIRSDDVVLVRGLNGNPNRLYLRRSMNPMWGPSDLLGKSGIGWWDYVESNRRIQIYSSAAVAMYGSNSFVMSPDAYRSWKGQLKVMSERYKDNKDFSMYEHLLMTQAKGEEASSEFKQEKKMFAIRNSEKAFSPVKPKGHDFLSRAELFSLGFIYEKK